MWDTMPPEAALGESIVAYPADPACRLWPRDQPMAANDAKYRTTSAGANELANGNHQPQDRDGGRQPRAGCRAISPHLAAAAPILLPKLQELSAQSACEPREASR